MVTGWRRAFCTSIPKRDDSNSNSKIFSDKQKQDNSHGSNRSSNSPRISSKFGFFSTPSTPRMRTEPVDSPSLRCRTSGGSVGSISVPNSPKLQCKTTPTSTSTPKKTSHSPRLFSRSSNPSSPKSPSSFSLLKTTLRLSKTRCGICLEIVKTGQGTAIFTAECSHTFHFPCIASHVKRNHILICPVCNATWKELPLLDSPKYQQNPNPQTDPKISKVNTKPLRVYNDDESLLSPSSVSRFNPIPESDESNDELQLEQEVEFQGFFVTAAASPLTQRRIPQRNNVEVSLLPEAAAVSVNKSCGTCAVVLKVKAPPSPAQTGMVSSRAPIDLVTVVDVSARMNGDKLQMLKRAMRLVISSLGDNDRLSIVAFSETSKRLLPLRRMTTIGRRSARRIVDAIGCTGQDSRVNDALRKASKVLEDRRESNPVATVMLLSDAHQQRVHAAAASWNRSYPVVTSTRFDRIPVHAIGFGSSSACDHAVQQEAFAKRLGAILCVAVQDLKLQLGFIPGSGPADITAVYSLIGRPEALGSGLIRVGELYAGEERELLVEFRVPTSGSGSHHVMSVGSSFRDPQSQELVYSKEQAISVPRAQTVRSPSIERLKSLHVTARAIAESRRLVEQQSDLSGAYRLLSSARALLVQSGSSSGGEFLRCLEAELTELQRVRQARRLREERRDGQQEEKAEAVTPTSAWRAAERLARVAIMRKSMNRVSDLHGFENARF